MYKEQKEDTTLYVALIAAAAVMLYLLSLMPGRSRKERFKPFEDTMIAHRGFFDMSLGIPENSIKAYERAAERGYGIELDVQITKDGELVCFHDESLKRMCGRSDKLTDLTYSEIKELSLCGTDQKVPLFRDAFDVIKGRVPVIIEIKAHGDYIKTAKLLMTFLDGYDGPYLVESFHPRLVMWLKKNRPEVLRGQLSTVFAKKKGVPYIARFIATNLMTNIFARPDFIAYDFHHAGQFSYRVMRAVYSVENVAWTIRSKDDLAKAKEVFSVFIFDSFDPGE